MEGKCHRCILALLGIALLSATWAATPAVAQERRLLKQSGFRLFAVSHLGEVTREVKYTGQSATFRIYLPPIPTIRREIRITTRLDSRFTFVSASRGGTYDSTSREVQWTLGGRMPVTRRTHIEFKVRCTDRGRIKVVATAALPPSGAEPRPRAVGTNSVVVTVHARPKVGWVPFDRVSKHGSTPSDNLKEETTTGTMVNFNVPGMHVKERKMEGVTYHSLSIPGLSNGLDIGKPELPIMGRLIEVPYGVSFTTEVVEAATISLDRYNVMPAQLPEPEQPNDWQDFVIDKKTYRNDAAFPASPVTVAAEDVGIIRGHRLVFLKINPIRYNPATRETIAFRRLEVRLNFSQPGQIRAAENRIRSRAFEDLLESAVANYKSPDRFRAPETEDDTESPDKLQGCDYLIITHGDLYTPTDAGDPINELAAWKRQKGLTTRVVQVSAISTETEADDIADDMRDYIQDAYNRWYPVPTYILLVGDVDRVPTHDGTGHRSHRTLPDASGATRETLVGTDLYYATVDPDPSTGSSDYFPDIFIGRISADSTADVDHAIQKILTYEQAPPTDADYYTDTPLVRLFEDDTDPPNAVGFPDPCPSDGQEDCTWVLIERSEELRDFLQARGYIAERIYGRSGNWAQGPLRWEDGSNLPPELTIAGDPANGIPGFPWNGAFAQIRDAFNAGRFLITYRGHGWNDGWGNPDFHTTDFGALTNADEYPVIFGLTCRTGWFDNETDHADLGTNTDCFAEQLLRLNRCGAVAIIASARNSWGAANNPATEGMCDALWPEFDPAISSGRLPRMGQINTYSKVYMANRLGACVERQLSFEMQNLFGDPEMSVWTEAPGDLSVSFPEGIGASGEQDFVVGVRDAGTGDAVPSAAVTLTRGNSIIATRQTNSGGIARFTIPGPGAGNAQITVVALDYRPFIDTVVINSGGATISRLDHDNGPTGQTFNVGGSGMGASETVSIRLGGASATPTSDTNGDFGLSGMPDVTLTVPGTQPLGPVNVLAHGQSSGRYAVDVFRVRSANPIDLAIYSQWDSSTWTRFPNISHATWNNPDIQLYDGGTAVESNNLDIARTYTIRAHIVNDTAFTAQSAKVTFKWALYGAGQNNQAWQDIGTISVDVPPGGTHTEVAGWKPPSTGHVCIKVLIYHLEDINEDNNRGQENCHVGTTASPAMVPFALHNPTKMPAMVHLELRQIIGAQEGDEERPVLLWLTHLKHPDPQMLQPGQRAKAWAVIEPHPKARSGDKAEFSLTAYVGKTVIGGINFIIYKK